METPKRTIRVSDETWDGLIFLRHSYFRQLTWEEMFERLLKTLFKNKDWKFVRDQILNSMNEQMDEYGFSEDDDDSINKAVSIAYETYHPLARDPADEEEFI